MAGALTAPSSDSRGRAVLVSRRRSRDDPRGARASAGAGAERRLPSSAVPRETFVHEAELRLADGADDREPGAAVTVALCGHWEHEGPCRWPHNNALVAETRPARFRVVFVADAADESEIRTRIVSALASGSSWTLVSHHPRPATADENDLGRRLGASHKVTS
jgi:hypothetical protein